MSGIAQRSAERREFMGSLHEYFQDVHKSLLAVDEQASEQMIDLLWDCYQGGRRLVLCGNGGSASTASHIVADLQKNLYLATGKAVWEVLSLCDSLPLITAWSNDTEYANVFAAQARSWLRPGDVLLAISGSGNSPNIVNAVEAANEIGAVTIGLSGYGGGRLATLAHHGIMLESRNMQVVEDVHMSVLHGVYRALLERVLADASPKS
jgi:D-sedoheptulose 7-phosphate isomerase